MAEGITAVWKRVTPELRDELVAFWLAEGALDDAGVAEARTEQVVCIGREADGSIWGVGTAVLQVLPQLGQPTYACRQFFSARRRGKGQMMAFFGVVRDTLELYNQALAQPESIGILLEIQNDMVAARYQLAYEPEADAYFIGYSPRGHHLRVVYFDGARLLLPPKPAQRSPPPSGGAGAAQG
ncbi:MAG TPA: hypothetical protein VLK29_09225 [Luteimonas sp.]|nr:hypothetical protein [Luteimonas sp.]